DRNLDGDLAVGRNAQEVDVQREVANRIQLVVLRQDLNLLSVDVDRRERGHETASVDALGDLLARKRDRKRGLLVTIDDSRNEAFAAKFTGGPLTNPFAQLGLELVRSRA